MVQSRARARSSVAYIHLLGSNDNGSLPAAPHADEGEKWRKYSPRALRLRVCDRCGIYLLLSCLRLLCLCVRCLSSHTSHTHATACSARKQWEIIIYILCFRLPHTYATLENFILPFAFSDWRNFPVSCMVCGSADCARSWGLLLRKTWATISSFF